MTHLPAIAARLTYGLFVLWLGLLAPLVYFDRFALNHHIQPYHLTLFKSGKRISTLPPAAVAPQLVQQLKQALSQPDDVITSVNPFAGLARSLHWSVDQLFLIACVTGLLLLPFGRLGLARQLAVASAHLRRPKKPPRLT